MVTGVIKSPKFVTINWSIAKTSFFSVAAYSHVVYWDNANTQKNNGHIKHIYENKGNIVYEYV